MSDTPRTDEVVGQREYGSLADSEYVRLARTLERENFKLKEEIAALKRLIVESKSATEGTLTRARDRQRELFRAKQLVTLAAAGDPLLSAMGRNLNQIPHGLNRVMNCVVAAMPKLRANLPE